MWQGRVGRVMASVDAGLGSTADVHGVNAGGSACKDVMNYRDDVVQVRTDPARPVVCVFVT